MKYLIRLFTIAITLFTLTAHAQLAPVDENRLANGGYDLVAYFTDHIATKGKKEFTTEFEGVKYQFASLAHQQLFQQKPEAYPPQCDGYCLKARINICYCTPNFVSLKDTHVPCKMVFKSLLNFLKSPAPSQSASPETKQVRMDIHYLIDFANSLARDSFVYRKTEEKKDADAFWLEEGALKFLVKFEGAWWGIRVITGPGQEEVRFEKQTGLEDALSEKDAIPLKKHPAPSYPNADYLFYFGDQKITDWLEGLHWGKDWGYNDNFKDPVGKQYQQWWAEKNPFYAQKGIFAIEKGWTMVWPDDEEPLQFDANNEFLFCTLHEAEPWLEVYRRKDTQALTSYARTT